MRLTFFIAAAILITVLVIIFRRRISLRDLAMVLAGVLLAYATRQTARKVKDVKDKFPDL